jgi:hypothetical protein
MKSVTFKHLMTGKNVTVVNPKSIAAVIHGNINKENEASISAVFLVIDKVPAPIPVMETEEEVMAILNKALTQE